jgi:hypothetical protein
MSKRGENGGLKLLAFELLLSTYALDSFDFVEGFKRRQTNNLSQMEFIRGC